MSYLQDGDGGALQGMPLGFAHRGGSQDENTLAAFRRAWEAGYAYLETDVHASADGVLYAFHDPTVDRTTNGTGAVASLSSAELDALTVRGPAGDPPPRLLTLLTELPQARFNADLKAPGIEAEFARVVAAAGAQDRVLAASFSPGRTRRVQRWLPLVARGASPWLIAASVLLGPLAAPVLRLAARRGVVALQVPVAWHGLPVVREAWLRRVHAAGLAAHVWTVDDEDEARILLARGVDGLMTDELGMLAGVLAEWGAWPQSTRVRDAAGPARG